MRLCGAQATTTTTILPLQQCDLAVRGYQWLFRRPFHQQDSVHGQPKHLVLHERAEEGGALYPIPDKLF